MASSQHRRVFVGNIPYDATEEQLIQICEDVGPVVSFRLVVDRETGKPKGYGFCEYKDEETALSARRNLQGYEINGRQLRVDFAENDKGSDRNREQGRGGPGVAPNAADVNKQQVGGPAGSMDATLNQQVGVSLAMTAASVMAGALGGAQATVSSSSNGPSQQPLLGNDPLTIHLAKMSKGQLIQVISEMKVLATQNYDLARQLLDACPQLPKALFQAQIMLGMVTPPMLQMPNIRQALAQASTQFPTQVRGQAPNHAHIGGAQENLIAAPSVVNALPPARPQQLGGMSSGPPMMAAMPMRPVQAPLLHNSRLSGPGSSGHGIQPAVPGGSMLLGGGSQAGSLVRPATSDTNRSAATAVGDGPWAGRIYPNSSTSLASADENGSLEQFGRPSKLVKLEDARGATLSGGHFPLSAASNPKLTNAAGISVIKEPQNLETQAPQLQVPPELESALLQQLKNLTPEQLSTLSPEQQQQVIQLQKMLR